GGTTNTTPAPPGIPYQAEVRNDSGEVLANANVNVRFTLHELTANGTVSYQETHAITTNELGLFAATIGAGTATQGTFASINWSQTTKFLQVEVDAENGYVTMGNQQLMSVPYALYAANGPAGPQGLAGPQGPAGIDGAPGPQGPAGNGLTDGTTTGEISYWNGSSWTNIPPGSQSQTLTMCNGVPTWTTGGICPGTITQLNCNSYSHNGNLIAGISATGVSTAIAYNGGNGGIYYTLSIPSTGVTGLTASLSPGSFATGSGTLLFAISGTPSTSGNANFQINIAGQTCTFSRLVNANSPTAITGHTCGALQVHNSALNYGSMTDQEGNVYKTIIIGNQEWMAENLKTSKYNNGENIPSITSNSIWSGLTTGATCWYNNDSATYNCPYGKLYNWYSVVDNRKLCPTGWHIPSEPEWTILSNNLGGASISGGKLKSAGTQYWPNPNAAGTNISGFSGIPGGYRINNSGTFFNFANVGFWWSSTQPNGQSALYYYLIASSNSLTSFSFDGGRTAGYSVRCIRD
ncbi:MAG: FISUMP domain-containing protein, partial [Flavobacteriales bacterium]